MREVPGQISVVLQLDLKVNFFIQAQSSVDATEKEFEAAHRSEVVTKNKKT